MTYVCDLRENSYNNVIEVNDRLFIEGQRYTKTNLAPVALSFGPTNFPLGTTAAGLVNASQLALSRTYVQGSTGILPQSGAAGMFESTKIACGQDVNIGFVYSPINNRYYGFAGTNLTGKMSSFDANFRPLNLESVTVHTMTNQVTNTQPMTVFCPLANGRWIYVSTQSGIVTSGYTGTTTTVINSLTETGVVGTAANITAGTPAIPYIGDNFVVVMAMPWATAAVQTSFYSVNRSTGVVSAATAWIPAVNMTQGGMGCFPSNAVTVSASEAYFYFPLMLAAGLTVYIGTVTGLNSGGTPAISAWNAANATLTAVGGGALDTSAVSLPGVPTSVQRHVKAFVFEDAGVRYLNVCVYEPGITTTVLPSFTHLYMWRLDSKTTATFIQKLALGDAGRVRAVMTTTSTQKRICVVYDDKVATYVWNPISNWFVQGVQDIASKEVGIDSQERVWVTTSNGTYQSADLSAQQLHVFENVSAAATITMAFAASSYEFQGTTLDSNIVLNAFDANGSRVALQVVLERISTNFSFSGSASTIVTTSTSGDTLVPISIFSTGLLNCRAAPLN